MKKYFWNETHDLSKTAELIIDKYIPQSGKTDFLETEVLRAALKIYYDYYNNGWGCNNWSSATLFILQNAKTINLNEKLINFLYYLNDEEYSVGRPINCLHLNDYFEENLENLIEFCIMLIVNNKNNLTKNEEDYLKIKSLPYYDEEYEKFDDE